MWIDVIMGLFGKSCIICKKSLVCALVFSLVIAGSVSAGMILLQCDAGEGALQAGWTRVNEGLNSNVDGGDIDHNSRVDLLDFAILGADWLQECSTLSGW